MRIWTKPISVESITALCAGCAESHLGMEFLEVGDDFIRGRVPVDERTRQPYGLLHGGVSVVLAETLAITELYLLFTRKMDGAVRQLNRAVGIIERARKAVSNVEHQR